MALVDEKFISELKSKCNIVDVAQKYCVLQRKGSVNHWACCPLPGHSEKTPSFTVNEVGQFYHCFGCGKGGDVFKFIEEVESLDFMGAVKLLAEQVGMEVPSDDSYNSDEAIQRRNHMDRLNKLMRDTAVFYVNNFADPRATEYINYVKKRGLTASTLKKFGMGVSLDFEGLPNHLKSLGYTDEEMIDAGVCSKSDKNGKLYDFEAERLIVPIINSLNKVIAFGGRTLNKNADFGKYKNTQDTVLFNKKRNLFGINYLKALKNEDTLDYVIMVEGYMDVISLYQAGFKNAVASMGTSLTLEQAKLLKRYTDKVIVCYDGDDAGQKATIRSLDIFVNEGFDVRVVTLPNGLDPDDYIKKYGAIKYLELVDNATPLLDYKLKIIQKGKNLKDVNDKRKYVSESLAFLRTIGDAFIREELLKKVREVSGISYESLKRDLENGTATVISSEPKGKIAVSINRGAGIERAERFVLCSLIYDKPYTKDFEFDLYYSSSVREKIADAVMDGSVTAPHLVSVVGEDGIEELNAVLTAGENIFDTKSEAKYFKDCVSMIKRSNIEAEIQQLNKLYASEINLVKKQEIAEMIQLKTIKLTEA